MKDRGWPRDSLALGGIAIGLLALFGWATGSMLLKAGVPGLTTMKANNAAGLALSGAGLLLLPAGRRRMTMAGPLAAACGALVLLVALLTLAEYASGRSFGLDELLFADPNSTSPPFPGRMAPATAAGLACIGAAVLLLAAGRQARRGVGTAHVLALVPAAIGYLSLAGYAYNVQGLYSFGPFVSVALGTGIAFAMLAAAILLCSPERGWLGPFAGMPVARRVLTRLLPLALLLPFIAGALIVWGARAAIYAPLFGPALFAVSTAGLGVGFAWFAARAVWRAERSLHAATQERDLIERRQALFLDLSEMLRSPTDESLHAVMALLGRSLEAGDVAYGDVDAVGEAVLIRHAWHECAADALPARLLLADFGADILARLRAGTTVTLGGAATRALSGPDSLSGQTLILVPQAESGVLAALLCVAHRGPAAWPDHAVPLAEHVAKRTWSALTRVRAQNALRDNERLLRVLLDTVPVGVIMADTTGRLTFGNAGVERVFRFPFIASTNVAEYRAWEGYDEAGQRVEGHAFPLARTLASGLPTEAEYQFACGDGVRRWVNIISAPMVGADGSLDGALVVCTDVDERRRGLDALRSSEERFRGLAAAMPAFIFIADQSGANIYSNEIFQQQTGRDAEALLGDGWLAAVHPDDRGRIGATWSAAWQSGDPYEAECRFGNLAGAYRSYIIRGTPLRIAGRITQWVGICLDVQDVVDARNALARVNFGLEARIAERTTDLTAALARLEAESIERAAAEAQVRQLQKMEALGQLTGGIAHDFNNMLSIVVGSLEMAKRRLRDQPDAVRIRSSIENAEEGARRAAQLTARLLAFSRQAALAPHALDANRLVGGMSELLRRTIGEAVRVETVLAGGLWPTYADAGELENALLNLCVNARDAMPEGGRLTIETSNSHLDDGYAAGHADVTAGQYVLIAVSDTGTGMQPAVLEHAFDPFYTTKAVGKGTGLGLSQVYGFVKQSGGHVAIYSEAGQGTTVKIYLPRHFGVAPKDAAPASVPMPDLPRARPGETVLVVEDEPAVRQVTVESLRELGYIVAEAADAEQALAALAAASRTDLLFTDIVMPGLNGRLLADAALRTRPGLAVLFATGYTRNAVVHHGTLDPGVALLPKPFTLEALARKVRAVLDGGGANRD